MTTSRQRNPMQATAFNLTGVDVSTQVNSTGVVELKLSTVTMESHEIMNELESTDFINIENLPPDVNQRKAIYAALLSRLESENGKHYIVSDATYSAELIAYINAINHSYTDDLVKRTNLLYSELDKLPECKLASEYKIDVLNNIDSDDFMERCKAVAYFQKERLIAMRPSLDNTAARKKMDERYSTEALFKKACSGKIMVFSAIKEEKIISTLVINLHAGQEKSLLDKVAYVSDLIVAEDHIKDTQFLKQFMTSVFKQFSQKFPSVKIFTLMAPGDSKDPLVHCISETDLFLKLDKNEQIKLGVIAFFVQSPDNKQKLNKTDTPATLFFRKMFSVGERKSDASDAKIIRAVAKF